MFYHYDAGTEDYLRPSELIGLDWITPVPNRGWLTLTPTLKPDPNTNLNPNLPY